MLSHLAYVSTRKKNCTDEEIEKILAACKVNNPPLEITGVLLYSDSKFIQYVEGEAASLMALYDKIKKDARHERVVMISYNSIAKRVFPSWHMGSRKIASDQISFATGVTPADREVFDKILGGRETEGSKVQELLLKFFKK